MEETFQKKCPKTMKSYPHAVGCIYKDGHLGCTCNGQNIKCHSPGYCTVKENNNIYKLVGKCKDIELIEQKNMITSS